MREWLKKRDILLRSNRVITAPWLSWLQRPTVNDALLLSEFKAEFESEGREFDPLWSSYLLLYGLFELSILI